MFVKRLVEDDCLTSQGVGCHTCDNYIIIHLQVHSLRSTNNIKMKPCEMMCGHYDRLWPK